MECSDSSKTTTIKKVIIFTKISKSSKGLSRGRNHSQNSTQLAQDSSATLARGARIRVGGGAAAAKARKRAKRFHHDLTIECMYGFQYAYGPHVG